MIRWMTLFLDRPASDFESATAVWSAVSGTTPSATRGAEGEFLTLLPPDGDAFLRIQRVGSGGGSHLDFHVDDVRVAADIWIELGATAVADLDGVVVLRSPAVCCFAPSGTTASTVARLRSRQAVPLARSSIRSVSTSRTTDSTTSATSGRP